MLYRWPVIAVIIVGSLILLSIAGCLISCLCCGYQCCKGCCGCCYKCCDCGGNSRNHKRKRDTFADHSSPYYQQPPPPQPMNYGNQQPAVSPAPPAYRGPRTAAFDQPKAAAVATNEDALPSMPTWADAQTRRVEDHSPVHETVEMDDLEAHDHADNPYYNHHSTSPAPGLMTRSGYSEVPANSTSPHPSPQPYHDDYLHDDGYSGGAGGLRVTNASNQDLHDSDYLHQQHQPYSPISPASPGYGAPPAGYPPPARYPSPGAAAAAMPSRLSPRPSPGPAPYRGFDNQPPPKVQVPNFSGPRAYDQAPSPRSPVSPPMPYAPYESHQQYQQAPFQAARSPPPRVAGSPVQHGQYRAFSPAISSSTPPPPFSETDHHQQAAAGTSDGDRPPSLLMAGRRPTPNLYRAV